ncbi:MAG: enoyl-ACP reductase [Phycisphaerae bacterium]|nr:enoyl-ACP reductase [Phycisphaerae bacterium]NUQ46376.1 enoyl-ACP reductase [Phycisphaerae bacterium]
MGLMNGKKGVILGVANDHSLAWHIAQRLHAEGAQLGFNHLPNEKMERRVRKLAEPIGAALIAPCDVADDASIREFVGRVRETFGTIDFLVHAVAYASREALSCRFHETSREDFKQAMDVSAYSLIGVCREALPVLREGASVVTLTYLGSVRVVPGYNVMGVCKAALESTVRYLAADMGDLKRIRVNAVSAGPCRTLSASGVGGFDKILEHYPTKSPLRRNIDPDEVGKSGLYFCSDLSTGVTGEIHYVDAGYSMIGW